MRQRCDFTRSLEADAPQITYERFARVRLRFQGSGAAYFGALLLISVIGFRFIAWDLSFTLRGLAFIAAGVAFLVMNLRLSRRESREQARAEARS